MARRERLTTQLADAIAAAVETGEAPHLAARACGIPKSTFYDWMRWGETGRRPYSEFSDKVQRALSASQSTALANRRSAVGPTTSRGIFVGRAAEMHQLKNALEHARAGHGRLLMLVGEPGIGKTRTAEEFVSYARQRDVWVLTGRCYEGDGAPAFWPWVQIIRTYIQNRPAKALITEMGAGAADLARVVPQIREHVADLPLPPVREADQTRFGLFDSISGFLKRAAARQPLVLLLDDLHWADKPSLLLLQFLAREMAGARLLVLGTYRDIEIDPAHPLSEIVSELRREPHFQRILLRGLPQDDVRALIAGLGGQDVPQAFVDAMFRQTEGNPFFVEEILRHLTEEGIIYRSADRWVSRLAPDQMGIPDGVRVVIGRRLARLSPACNWVLTVAAVIGRDFAVEALRRLCCTAGFEAFRAAANGRFHDLTEEQLREVLEEARRVRVITVVPNAAGHYRFSHALIRETLYEQQPSGQRARLHELVAGVLEDMYRTNPSPHLAEMAYHFFEGSAARGSADKAITYAVKAAEQAAAVLAYEESAGHYMRALQVLDARWEAGRPAEAQCDVRQRCQLLLALGEAQRRAGEALRVSATFQQAADLARALKEPEQFARAALGFQAIAWDFEGGESDETHMGLLEEAAVGLGTADSVLRAQVLARLARVPHRSILPQRRVALSHEAVQMARRLGDPGTLAITLVSKCLALWRSEGAEKMLDSAREIVRLSEEAGDRALALEGRITYATGLLEIGDVAAVDREIQAFSRLAEELRQPRYVWIASWFRAMRATLQGRFDAAEQLAQQALAVGQHVDPGNALQMFGAQLLAIRREQGRLEELEPAVVGLAAQYPTVTAWRAALAMLHCELNREGDARDDFECLAANNFVDVPLDLLWLPAVTLLSEVCAFLGDAPRAADLYDLLLPHARRNVIFGVGGACLGSASRHLGLLARTLQRWEEAEAHFETALSFNTSLGARPAVVRTKHEYAATLLARGRPEDRQKAVRLLRQALATSQKLGMQHRAGEIARLLRSAEEADAGREAAESPHHSGRNGGVPENVFRKEGEFWTLASGDRIIRLRDAKGLHYLAYLLRHPGEEVHASALVTVLHCGGARHMQAAVAGERAAQPKPAMAVLQDADVGPLLDATAKAAYRRRLSDLREELEEAERFNDLGRVTRAREEMDVIAQHLKAAIGLGGNDRKAASYSERARLTVTQCIKATIRKIRAVHPALGQHFATNIKTGYSCSYVPDPAHPVTWSL